MITSEQLMNYYGNNPRILMPAIPKFHFYKLKLQDGRMIHIREKINNQRELIAVLKEYLPTDVYYSASQFLSPERVTAKEKYNYKYADEIFLKNDLVFDLDENYSIEGWDKARKETIKLIEFMRTLNNEPTYILSTGGKGFQVKYRNQKILGAIDPLKRAKFIKYARIQLADRIKKEGIKIDEAITTDIHRVIRLPETVHSSGFVSTIIKEEDLHLPIRKLIKKLRYVGDNAPAIPLRHKDQEKMTAAPKGASASLDTSGEVSASGEAVSPKIFTTFVSNKIKGLKDRYVLFLEYRDKSIRFVRKDIRALIKQYKTSDFYIFQTKDRFYAICYQSFTHRRLCKILNASKSDNQVQARFKKTWIRVLPKYKDGVFVDNSEVKFIEEIKGQNRKCFISETHRKYINRLIECNIDLENPKHKRGEIIFISAEVSK